MPALTAVRTPDTLNVKPTRPAAQEARDPTLPGDGGRVWAELGDKPLVGIYQTHSHESFWKYLPAGSSTAYSTDWSKTIVQVGWWFAQDLYDRGVDTVQSRVDNMAEGILASYSRAYYTAKQLLRWYPSVRLLIDLHRAPHNVPPASIDGVSTAKILIVVGTNKILPNEYWHQNLEVALRLAHDLAQVAPGILNGQGIQMVPYRYNQELMPGDLMIEVGGANNTLAEERYAVADLAEAVAMMLRSADHAPRPRS
jgi:stage II sporulation protein P